MYTSIEPDETEEEDADEKTALTQAASGSDAYFCVHSDGGRGGARGLPLAGIAASVTHGSWLTRSAVVTLGTAALATLCWLRVTEGDLPEGAPLRKRAHATGAEGLYGIQSSVQSSDDPSSPYAVEVTLPPLRPRSRHPPYASAPTRAPFGGSQEHRGQSQYHGPGTPTQWHRGPALQLDGVVTDVPVEIPEFHSRKWTAHNFPCEEGPLPDLWGYNVSSVTDSPLRVLTADISYGHPFLNGTLSGYDVLAFQGCDNYTRVSQLIVPENSGYVALATGLSTCMAYASTRWRLANSGVSFVGVDALSRKSSAQWAHLEDRSHGHSVFFVNHHGPLPLNSGGACGGVAVAYKIASLVKSKAKPGDAIVIAGAFHADAYSPTMVSLASQLKPSIAGTNRWGFEHVLSNLGPQCTTKVEHADDYTASLVLDLGGRCSSDTESQKVASNLTAAADKYALLYHHLPTALPYLRDGQERGEKLTTLEMRSWSCRGACTGGGCCNAADCFWECMQNEAYRGICNSTFWNAGEFRCDLFAHPKAYSNETTPPVPQQPRAPLVHFYVYRAMNDDKYELDNVDAANLAGEMYYVNHEVVSSSCPRHYDITRIVRLKVTMRPTLEVYNSGSAHPNFMPFITFDFGACSGAGCPKLWAKYGFNPGCQRATFADSGAFRYPRGVWYSFPGSCPSRKFGQKTGDCTLQEPGGRCLAPTGERDCTWHLEPAGEISVDELSGITNYTEFCARHKKEYSLETDRGTGFHFWDDRKNATRCQERIDAAQALFARKYPTMPLYPDPPCMLPGTR